MRGEVLKPDDASGPGLILGEDGKRYHFITPRVHKGAALKEGSPVDFIALGDDARDIYPLAAAAGAPANPSNSPGMPPTPAVASKADSLFKYFLRAITRNYFKFHGRSRRAEYWGFVLYLVVFFIVALVLDTFLGALFFGISGPEDSDFAPVITVLFWLYTAIPGMALTIRRLHDQDISGWLYLINLVPYIGGLILFILMFFDSRYLPNKHGPSPKYAAAQTVQVFS